MVITAKEVHKGRGEVELQELTIKGIRVHTMVRLFQIQEEEVRHQTLEASLRQEGIKDKHVILTMPTLMETLLFGTKHTAGLNGQGHTISKKFLSRVS